MLLSILSVKSFVLLLMSMFGGLVSMLDYFIMVLSRLVGIIYHMKDRMLKKEYRCVPEYPMGFLRVPHGRGTLGHFTTHVRLDVINKLLK